MSVSIFHRNMQTQLDERERYTKEAEKKIR